jgi:hypothetical protein
MLASLRSSFTSLLARRRAQAEFSLPPYRREFDELITMTQISLQNTYSNIAGKLINSSDMKNVAFEIDINNTNETIISIRHIKDGTIFFSKSYVSPTHAKSALTQDLSDLQKLRERQNQSISRLLINERKINLVIVGISSAFVLISEGFIEGFAKMITSWSTLLVVVFAALVFLDNLLLRFRARQGMFGNTEHEAREIIAFILRNADNLDDGDSERRIFDLEQSEESIIMEGYGVGAHP